MKKLTDIYEKLYRHFGPRHWWPSTDGPFEVIIGAILTQNTAWSNVEKAISNLKKEKALIPRKLKAVPQKKLAKLIRSSGFFNEKAKKLKHFLDFLFGQYEGSIFRMKREKLPILREKLLSVKGIGPETADSILLYALDKPIFVIDAYTKRILSRHSLAREDATYDELQQLFMDNLKPDVKLFNEYHALIVETGKQFCKTKNPNCGACPLGNLRRYI